jgi:ATP-dependent helicase HrpA
MRWDFGDLREVIEAGHAGWKIRQYPALKDEGDGVSVGLYTDPAKARAIHAIGLARLFVLSLGKEAKTLVRFRQLPLQASLYLRNVGYADAAIADDFLLAVAAEAFVRDQPDIRTVAVFTERLKSCYSRLAEAQGELSRIFFDTITAAAERMRIAESDERLSPATVAAVKNQLAWLVFPGFLRNVPLSRLRHYRRYLEGVRIRLERARLSPSTDAEREALVAPYWNRYRETVTAQKVPRFNAEALADYRWMVEEFRVSVFAQELRTPTPISAKRLDAKWAEVMR